MADIIIDGNDGNFIIESGSNSVPVFKISGNTVEISGSLIPGEAFSGSAISELGSIDYPWKELYVESASINFVNTSLPSGHSDRKVTFSRDDVENLQAGRPPRGVKPLSRFSNYFAMSGRVSAVNKWYCKGNLDRMSLSTILASSDPHSTAVSYLAGTRYQAFIASQAMVINNAYATFINDRNDDNIIFTMFKGTFVSGGHATITITRIGSAFAPTMTQSNNFSVAQAFTSGNTLAAGDFIMFTMHVTSFTSTSYPQIAITIDGQYT
jgi:hypothetical protein